MVLVRAFSKVVVRIMVVLATVLTLTVGTSDQLARLAASGQWAEVLASATSRREQLPLRPDESLIAAEAARYLGEEQRQRLFLAQAATAEGALGSVARVELAARVEDPGTAVQLVVPLLRDRRVPARLQEHAVRVAVQAVRGGLSVERRQQLEDTIGRMHRARRRPLEATLAATSAPVQEGRLLGMLRLSVRDDAALVAAMALTGRSDLSVRHRWQVAQALFVHGRYELAASELEPLAEARWSQRARAAFLRGRCAFRLERWETAVHWYQRALVDAEDRSERSDVRSHLARALELAGDLGGAVETVQRAVAETETDRFRLHAIRLLLRAGLRDAVPPLTAELESSDARARADVLIALDDLRRGARASAIERLSVVASGPWQGPARVLAARLAVTDDGAGSQAAELLQTLCETRQTHRYWQYRARAVLSDLPAPLVAQWRSHCAAEIVGARTSDRFTAVTRWAGAEPSPEHFDALRRIAVAADIMPPIVRAPEFPGELAGALWHLGLLDLAARWDPRGFPRATLSEQAWTAGRLVAAQASPEAMLMVDRIWRAAGGDQGGDHRLLPSSLQEGLYPLPWSDTVVAAARDVGVDPALLSALVREESRWDPRARSAVGARGLTQLMPATAAAVARRLGRPAPTPEALADPEVALILGAGELAALLERFNGRAAPTIAAYNAGAEQAARWLEQCGAECPQEQYLLTVTFAATRSYLERVLASQAVYRQLYPRLRPPELGNQSGREPQPR